MNLWAVILASEELTKRIGIAKKPSRSNFHNINGSFMQRIIKSVFWLVGCSGVGYFLLQVTQPSEQKIREIRNSSQFNRDQNRQAQLFMDKLKESTQNK